MSSVCPSATGMRGASFFVNDGKHAAAHAGECRLRAPDGERLHLPHDEQPAILSMSPLGRKTPLIGISRGARRGRTENLLVQIRGAAQNHPFFAVAADGDAGLGPPLGARIPFPCEAAIRAKTIPFHCGKPPPAAEPRTRKRTSRRPQAVSRVGPRSDLGGSVAGDFHADADFADFRGGPSHGELLRVPAAFCFISSLRRPFECGRRQRARTSLASHNVMIPPPRRLDHKGGFSPKRPGKYPAPTPSSLSDPDFLGRTRY